MASMLWVESPELDALFCGRNLILPGQQNAKLSDLVRLLAYLECENTQAGTRIFLARRTINMVRPTWGVSADAASYLRGHLM
jgi:hypothetical protein